MDKYEKYEIIKNIPVPTIEALDVLFGSKPVLYGTLIVSDNTEVESVINNLESLGLVVKFQEEFDSIDNISTTNSKDDLELNFALSKSKSKANNFLQYESQNKHQRMGELLGYPKCCSQRFNNYFPEQNSKWTGEKIAKYLIERLNEFKIYPFHTNRLLRFSEYGALLYHFPCELDCEKSIKIAKRRYDILKDVDPNRAFKIKNNLSSLVLFEINEDRDGFYEEVTNVVYAPNYEYNNMELKINGNLYKGSEYTDDKFYQEMCSINNIIIKSNNSYSIDNKNLDKNNFRVIAFK